MRPAPLLPLVAVLVAAAVPAPVAAAPARAVATTAAGCHGTRVDRTLCRMNLARRAHGLRPLSRNRLLSRAAVQKADDMVARHYFAHVSPTGETLTSRVAATGWMRRRHNWRIAENLAWGVGNRSTPAALVRGWLHSPPHRRILLSASYGAVGIGLVPATPSGAAGATLVADFGS